MALYRGRVLLVAGATCAALALVLLADPAAAKAAPDGELKPETVTTEGRRRAAEREHRRRRDRDDGGDPSKKIDRKAAEAQMVEMHDWWCKDQGHAAEEVCTMWYKWYNSAEDAKDREKPDRKRMRAADIMAQAKLMHDAWCKIGSNAETHPCERWEKGRQRREREEEL